MNEAVMQEVLIFSDYICPFCFIGKHRIEQLAAEISLRPVWKPFEIHPEVPAEGIQLDRFSAEMITSLEHNVRSLAEEIGLEFQMPRKLPNSRLALIGGEIAKESGDFERYHTGVFRAYFQSSEDIGNLDVLAQIAETAGIAADDFRASIGEQRFSEALIAARREAHAFGLTAVPSFVFAGNRVVVGAQPYKAMKDMAEKTVRNSA